MNIYLMVFIGLVLVGAYAFLTRRKIRYIDRDTIFKNGKIIRIKYEISLYATDGSEVRKLRYNENIEIIGTVVNPIIFHEWYVVKVNKDELGLINPIFLIHQEIIK